MTDFQAVAPSRDVSKFDYLDDVRFHQATAMDDTGDRKRKPHTLEIVEPSIASRATVWCVCVCVTHGVCFLLDADGVDLGRQRATLTYWAICGN